MSVRTYKGYPNGAQI